MQMLHRDSLAVESIHPLIAICLFGDRRDTADRDHVRVASLIKRLRNGSACSTLSIASSSFAAPFTSKKLVMLPTATTSASYGRTREGAFDTIDVEQGIDENRA
jgi:hypothetical protein